MLCLKVLFPFFSLFISYFMIEMRTLTIYSLDPFWLLLCIEINRQSFMRQKTDTKWLGSGERSELQCRASLGHCDHDKHLCQILFIFVIFGSHMSLRSDNICLSVFLLSITNLFTVINLNLSFCIIFDTHTIFTWYPILFYLPHVAWWALSREGELPKGSSKAFLVI